MNNIKRIPIAVMLIAGAVTGIIAYVRDFSLINFLWITIASLVVFYVIGAILSNVILRYVKENKEAEEKEKERAAAEEGAVIEKEVVPDEKQDQEEEES